jgi:hypothetical protein
MWLHLAPRDLCYKLALRHFATRLHWLWYSELDFGGNETTLKEVFCIKIHYRNLPIIYNHLHTFLYV